MGTKQFPPPSTSTEEEQVQEEGAPERLMLLDLLPGQVLLKLCAGVQRRSGIFGHCLKGNRPLLKSDEVKEDSIRPTAPIFAVKGSNLGIILSITTLKYSQS